MAIKDAMQGHRKLLVLGLTAMAMTPASARTAIDMDTSGGASTIGNSSSDSADKPYVLQCVPYARNVTGIQIRGDAHTWWGQAEGRYARGHTPVVGAVLAIKPYHNSKLGHVAAVSKVIDSRTILVDHANWSQPGKIERNVTVLDVSPDNDWSEVRVWYGPSNNLGTTHWPVAGFIYNAPPGKGPSASRIRTSSRDRPTSRHADPIGAIIDGTY